MNSESGPSFPQTRKIVPCPDVESPLTGGKLLKKGNGEITAETIYGNETLYSFLTLYFHEELDDPVFQRDHAREIAADPRWTYSRCMAACLPFHPRLQSILSE